MPRLPWMLLWALLWSASAWGANLTFSWTPPAANVDGSIPANIAGYRIYCRLPGEAYSTYVDVGTAATGTFTGLTANTLYYCTVRAYDIALTEGPLSQESGNLTGPTTPTPPPGLRLAGQTCRQVRLRWQRALDDVAVTQYRVRRDNVQIGTTQGTVLLYDDTTVSPNTAYTFHVRAADAAANESGDSNPVVTTTPVCP
jgi:chitodextrinase